MKKLRVAMFCTNQWTTPPPEDTFYAPLWVAGQIADGMAKLGHDVTYFGAVGSRLRHAKLETLGMRPEWTNPELAPFLPRQHGEVFTVFEYLMLADIYRRANAGEFHLVHVHPVRRAVPMGITSRVPTVITLHDPVTGFYRWMLRYAKAHVPQIHLVSISNAQRRGEPRLNYAGTVYNGVDIRRYAFNPNPGKHLIAAGRFVPDKGLDVAVRAAKLAKRPLHLAGGVASGPYWERELKSRLGNGRRYVGMLKNRDMPKFFGSGRVLLNPLRWEEPFGLVMIEAMACGTPVVAFPHGSASEIVKPGVSGYLVKTLPELVRAIPKAEALDRKKVRAYVQEHFSIERMVLGYENVYQKVLNSKS